MLPTFRKASRQALISMVKTKHTMGTPQIREKAHPEDHVKGEDFVNSAKIESEGREERMRQGEGWTLQEKNVPQPPSLVRHPLFPHPGGICKETNSLRYCRPCRERGKWGVQSRFSSTYRHHHHHQQSLLAKFLFSTSFRGTGKVLPERKVLSRGRKTILCIFSGLNFSLQTMFMISPSS